MADADADAGAEAEAGAEVECEGCTCRRASSASSRDASVRSGAACCGAWAWTNEVHATCHMLGGDAGRKIALYMHMAAAAHALCTRACCSASAWVSCAPVQS